MLKYFLHTLVSLGVLSVMVFSSETVMSQTTNKYFLIAKSTKNYDEAKQFALKLSRKSGIKTDFRGLMQAKRLGLSEDKKSCQEEGFDFPCYIPRGRYDDGVYISIEYSTAYSGFTEGYYIIVVASGEISKSVLVQIKNIVPDAYVKQSAVYMGCMH